MPRNLQAMVGPLLREPWAMPVGSNPGASVETSALADPARGEVLLVAVERDEGVLLALRDDAALSFGREALEAMELAHSLARRWSPTLAYPGCARRESPRASLLWCPSAAPRTLEGASFGLAFVLAESSRIMGHSVPADLCASATIRSDGALGRVEGLESKLRAIAAAALRVRRVLVAREQLAEAEDHIAKHGLLLHALGYDHVRSAIDAVFHEVANEPPAEWADPTNRERGIAEHYEHAHQGPPRPDWSSVVRAARWLVERAPESPRAAFALAISQRHAGAPAATIPWNDEHGDRWGLAHVAQVVQAAADAGDEQCETYALRALALADQCPAEPGAIRARGAIARAFAILRDYPRAAEQAEIAARRWERRDERSAASMVVCEWLRVASVLGDERAFERAAALRPWFEASATSLSYFDLAECAGLVRLGRFDEALRVAERAPTSADAQSYVGRSMARWQARAWSGRGEAARASEVREALHRVAPESIEVALTELDRAIEARDASAATLAWEAIVAQSPQGTRWLVERASVAERARVLADEYPY